MAHINPAFVTASSELAVNNGQLKNSKNHIMAQTNPAFDNKRSELAVVKDQSKTSRKATVNQSNPAFDNKQSELALDPNQENTGEKLLKTTGPILTEEIPQTSKWREFTDMIRSKWRWSWVFNGIVLLTLSVLIVVLDLGIIPFRALGYLCQDPKLSHKFRGDTISDGCLIAVTALAPFVGVFMIEMFVVKTYQASRNWWRRRNFCQALYWYSQFTLGLLILLFLTQLAKSVIAEPRPDFFDTCRPDKFNCTGYVTEFKCTNTDIPHRIVRDSLKSFPSGHAALGVYVGIFLAWFFQSRVPYSGYLIVPLLQCLCLGWGLVCGLTRLTDYRHHWWDVLVGSILGVCIAVFTVNVFCRNFTVYENRNSKSRKQDKNLNEPEASINSWYKKALTKSDSGPPQDDRELREVK